MAKNQQIRIFTEGNWTRWALAATLLLGILFAFTANARAEFDTAPDIFTSQVSQAGIQNAGRTEIVRRVAQEADLLYPDLVVLPPHDMRVQNLEWEDGGPFLRFGNSILNVGQGPLELRVSADAGEEGVFSVNQRLYLSGGGGSTDIEVGRFIFHPPHDHWHLDDFVRYEIWSLDAGGELEEMLISSGKISYCMTDVHAAEEQPVAGRRAPDAIYMTCGNKRQGLSVGWIDTYHFWYEGQSLDIGSLPSGTYALRSIVDPDNFVRETNEENNATIVTFQLEGMDVSVLDSQERLPAPAPEESSHSSHSNHSHQSHSVDEEELSWPDGLTPR